eukprot:gnl/MRDRNA2_/MRDRNA2_69961_c0_seq1.p1 gnl/MRDRNA2_/MRDRNA2_69961_c0~~gnl/MRDRNA2_/MRDRNA2_69961_c0_seq1.p1  ORF type:complete len:184 (-),score=46.18 gnl/MRDRNA2_/MRDRNA2_69961_c0_seq1:63-614(-)
MSKAKNLGQVSRWDKIRESIEVANAAAAIDVKSKMQMLIVKVSRKSDPPVFGFEDWVHEDEDEGGLRLTSIPEHSTLSSWNEMKPMKKVCKYSVIKKINNISGSTAQGRRKMMIVLHTSSELEMEIHNPVVKTFKDAVALTKIAKKEQEGKQEEESFISHEFNEVKHALGSRQGSARGSGAYC